MQQQTMDRCRFTVELPDGYQAETALRYHGRDPAGPAEHWQGSLLQKGVLLADSPLLLQLDIRSHSVAVELRGAAPPDWQAIQPRALRMVQGMLGLTGARERFRQMATQQPDVAALLAGREPLYLPLAATPFEALCWAIIGQQINLRFATALRRSLIQLAGVAIAGSVLLTHPGPEQVARLSVEQLCAQRFSRSKATYLLGAAHAVLDGRLPLSDMAGQDAATAERQLLALHGIGPWTARYVMMRGLGFPDCAPIGDSGLATALQRFYALPARPDARQTEQLMQAFSPCRSLATLHFWASLEETA